MGMPAMRVVIHPKTSRDILFSTPLRPRAGAVGSCVKLRPVRKGCQEIVPVAGGAKRPRRGVDPLARSALGCPGSAACAARFRRPGGAHPGDSMRAPVAEGGEVDGQSEAGAL